jgi:pyruvate/2-oxoglutarate dehydrogenase complex dihydrolipoamide dehydrogenase (E3) component
VKIHLAKGTDTILGATVVGGPAGDIITTITSGMYNGLGLTKLAGCIFPYPTFAYAIKIIADEFNRNKGWPKIISAVKKL